ncbi:hypothetical protein GALMADRAFT_230016 [Galerina marginata CBS 339.88]|uniref:Pyrroloquinoline quinone-dependent pyranose dehydrogenase beta-propeller domain-containing protein n=1 Tax=Galerina marginata (strain CBS 339.88) TaxID=685588 RepID=A0A067SIJ0_GALM3|nr:hypothetical protein GALMADRAFT_230016 [Galerina marginata CBS 339.88]
MPFPGFLAPSSRNQMAYLRLLAISFGFLAATAKSTFQPLGVAFKSPVTVAPGFSASVLFSNLTTPRGIAFDASHNLLVVERGFGVTAFNPVSSPTPGWLRTVVIENAAFTQGIQVDGSNLYVSTAGDALLYRYDATSKSISTLVPPRSVVTGIPADGELTTHTLQLEKDPTGRSVALLIASGPKTNIDVTARDPASGRSQIRRFVLPAGVLDPPPPTSGIAFPPPLNWADGQVIAFGIRNPAGFAFPPSIPPPTDPLQTRTLVVVENGASIDNTTGLTKTFVNDNPADEAELVTYPTNLNGPLELPIPAPKSYGFPDCTTLWNGAADPVGDPQFVGKPRGFQFSLQLDPTRNDAWCQNKLNNQPPILSFQAHSVPLDIKFFNPSPIITSSAKAFPASFINQPFVSFHGSFDRTPPTGYGVVRVPSLFGPGVSTALGYTFLIQATNLSTCPGTCIRPVGLAFGEHDARLYVSSDSSGELFVIERA